MSKLKDCEIRRMHIFNANNHNNIMIKNHANMEYLHLATRKIAKKKNTKKGLG